MCAASAPLPGWPLTPKFLIRNTPCGVTVTLCVSAKGELTRTQGYDSPE